TQSDSGLGRHGVAALDLGAVRPHRDGRYGAGAGRRQCRGAGARHAQSYCQADPYEGAKQAVAEAWRNITAVGAVPLAVTDNLNYGNPQKPEIMWQIVAGVDGIRDACIALDFPVIGGNCSLYHETHGEAILPTPAI